MNRFTAFIKKEFLHILRDPRTLLIMFGMPVAQVILFGFAITNEINNAKIGILDQSKDVVTQKLISKILSTGYFELENYLNSEREIEQVFREGKVKEVIVFGPNFASDFQNGTANLQIIADATDPNTGTTLINYTNAIVNDFIRQEFVEFPRILPIQMETRMWYNPELLGVFYFIPGVITIILMLVSTMLTSISIAREKELGTMEVLLASPMKPVQVIIAKVIPYLFLSFFNAIVILLMGYFVFHLPFQGSIVFLLLETLLFIIVALSLGVLISTKVDTQQLALMISLFALMLPTILLSGFIFPVENMPVALQLISHIIPAKWFVVIVKSIILKGNDITHLWKETLILVAFVVVFIGASIKNYKVRLE